MLENFSKVRDLQAKSRGFLGFLLLLRRFSKLFVVFSSKRVSWRFLENFPRVGNLQAESRGFLGFLLLLKSFQSISSYSNPQSYVRGCWRTFLRFGTSKPNPWAFRDSSCFFRCFQFLSYININKA